MNLVGPLVLLAKVVVSFLVFWVRFTYPGSGRTSSAAGLEGPHPAVAGEHPGDHGTEGGLVDGQAPAPKTPGWSRAWASRSRRWHDAVPGQGIETLIPAPSKGAATV